MRKITTFTHVSADGFFAGPNGEIDWFKAIKKDAEYDKFSHEGAQSGDTLIFGHTTYKMMASYWPTPDAIKNDPEMAKVMNNSPKIVFSKAMRGVDEAPHWKNITLMNDIKPEEIIELKEEGSGDFTILGSGTIVQQLSSLGLIDEYSLVVVPIVLGAGKPLFKDIKMTNLNLLEAKSFKNGLVWLRYQPGK